MNTQGDIILPDARRLAYAEFGKPSGYPILYFHGAPSSRLEPLLMREFDFKLNEIRMPLKLFHGERDVNAPIALVRRMVAELPSAQLVTYENEAHFSTLCNHVDEFAEAIVHP